MKNKIKRSFIPSPCSYTNLKFSATSPNSRRETNGSTRTPYTPYPAHSEASVLCPAVLMSTGEPPLRIAGPPDGIRTPPCSLDAVGRQGDQAAHLIRRGKPSNPQKVSQLVIPVVFSVTTICASHLLDSKASAFRTPEVPTAKLLWVWNAY